MSIKTYNSFQLWRMWFPTKKCFLWQSTGACGSAVHWGTALQSGRSQVVTGISGHTMTLGSTQPATEMSTRNISCGDKGSRCIVLTTLPPSCADCLEIWEPQPPGTLRNCLGLYRDCFTFLWHSTRLKDRRWNVLECIFQRLLFPIAVCGIYPILFIWHNQCCNYWRASTM